MPVNAKLVEEVRQGLRNESDAAKASFLPHFFKSDGNNKDIFLGVTVPKQRAITRKYFKLLTPKDVVMLLHSEIHEERLTALMTWVLQFRAGDDATKQGIYELYLANTNWVNNWDLVDSSASYIVGSYIYDKDRSILTKLSHSENVWERRIAMLAAGEFIRHGEYEWVLKLAKQYMNDTHHYIHKATGWMLREVGKRDEQLLRSFLETYASTMPRIELRYAIEKFNAQDRAYYLHLKNKTNQSK